MPNPSQVWVCLEVKHIIELFNSTNWGLLNYYRFADNFASMSRIQYILHLSLAKTLAHKLRVPVKQLYCEHGRNLEFSWKDSEGKERKTFFKTNSDWTRNPIAFLTGRDYPDPLEMHVRFRTRSLLGHSCIICKATDGVQMHHVRHIRKVGANPSAGSPG